MGLLPGSAAVRSPSASRIQGWCGSSEVTTISPTSPGGDGIAGAGPHDFHDQILVDDHALARRGLEGDEAEIGGAEGLVGVDAARLDFVLERGAERLRPRPARA